MGVISETKMMMNVLLVLSFAAVVLGAPPGGPRKFAAPLQPRLIPEEEGDNLINYGGYGGRQAPIYAPEKRSASFYDFDVLDMIPSAQEFYEPPSYIYRTQEENNAERFP